MRRVRQLGRILVRVLVGLVWIVALPIYSVYLVGDLVLKGWR